MSDTERLNLIEHYKWKISLCYGGWHITSNFASICVFAPTLREAIDEALRQQFVWATNKETN